MKRSFTLIELVLTLFLSVMVLVFISGVQSNFSREINTLQTQKSLAQESAIMMMLLKDGFMSDEQKFITGIVSADNFSTSLKYKNHTSSKKIEANIDNNHLKIEQSDFGERTFDRLNISNFTYLELDAGAGLYAIAFDVNKSHETFNTVTQEPSYRRYFKMVYAR